MRSLFFLGLASITTLTACGSSDTGSGGKGGSGGTTCAAGQCGGGGSAGGGGGGAAPITGSIPGKVKRYDYAFDVDLRTADTKLTVDVAAPGGDCTDFESRQPTTGDVTWNGATATTATTDMGVLHACGQGLASGPLEVRAPTVFPKKKFFGLDVGFSHKPNMNGGDFAYLVSWVGGCDQFAPCDNDPGTLSEFHFDIHHAPGTTVLCPGKLTPGAESTRCDIEGTLAPTYSAVGWAADAQWKKKPFMKANGVDWVFYEVPGGTLASSLDVTVMSDFFGWMTDLLGPFPYGNELRFAGGPTAWLGFEHPANIVLLEDLDKIATDYADAMTHVTMHETTHQWAGDRSTIATAADFVWKEATAEYLPYVFEDEHLPPDVGAASLEYWDGISLQSLHYPRPTDEPPPPVQTFYGDVYGPGPMVLYVQLEDLIGRDKVLAGIQAFLKDAGARSVDDLRKAMEAASGENLQPYFDAWVFGTGAPEWPTMKVATSQVGSEVTVTVTQENASGKLYGCVVEVEVQTANDKATATIDFGLDPQSAVASAKVTLADPVSSTVLDPRHRLVARQKAAPAVEPKPRPVWIF